MEVFVIHVEEQIVQVASNVKRCDDGNTIGALLHP